MALLGLTLRVEDETNRLTLHPIGFVRTEKTRKFDAPHQPDGAAAETNRIELLPEYERTLDDLEGFERIWLVSWFHRNTTWRARVLPPRGPAKRRGVFATRSPHRPNPLGLTGVPLLAVEGLTLVVGPLDLVDGTPILDIKPYLPRIDAFPDASEGWVGEVEAELASRTRYEIHVSELARRQLDYLREVWGIDFTPRAFDLLSLDPSPHRTRRILRLDDGRSRMACGPWRLYYTVDGQRVTIGSVGKGYADDLLDAPFADEIPERDAQIAFAGQAFSTEAPDP